MGQSCLAVATVMTSCHLSPPLSINALSRGTHVRFARALKSLRQSPLMWVVVDMPFAAKGERLASIDAFTSIALCAFVCTARCGCEAACAKGCVISVDVDAITSLCFGSLREHMS